MTTTVLLMVATGVLCALYVLTIELLEYRKWHGTRIVTCPETHASVAVEVDARHAALSAGIDELRLKQCSRWPERCDCGQECLRQIERAPEDCLLRNILTRWYEKRACAFCGSRFGTIHSWDNKPGFVGRDGATLMLCSEVPHGRLPDVLATYGAVCWNCYIAEEFRHDHPELIVDWPPGVHPQHAGEHG